ncbi:hypothetical protein AMK26_04520 [Streptomyces sp. CB03234]|uniref:hypothetical protein n=1 Tax=Streptomyces sp. (strain CB03234) TaxID=1703937 RepID=UPI00093DF58B|nr:hypothetical protein [Streptomyces sp. CB03234]OKK08284.1 hypothetical protein AMK26_04520 [Streptomyces sp. CB03234]
MSSTEPAKEPTQDSPRRRRSPLVVASVAAAVLLAGGGGAYFATVASDGEEPRGVPAADGKQPPPLVLDGHTESGTGPGIAPGEPDPNGVVYRAAGTLPKGPESAHVYRPEGAVGAAEVARLAKALGVEGTPKAAGSAWKVGPDKDGSGATLQVERQAPGVWTFGTAPVGDNCLKGKECPTGGQPQGGGQPVSEAAAKKAAAPVLEALGQQDAELDATQVMGAVRVVNADPVVGGLPTYGWSTGIQVDADGSVAGGSGRLKAPAESHEYPVIGAAEALKLLNAGAGDGRVGIGGGIGGCATPAPLEDSGTTPAAPCEPEPGSTAKETVTVSRAVFGLAAHYTAGRPALVPSWLFEVAPKGDARPFTITYPAVAPKHVAPAPAPAPTTPGTPGTGKAPRQVESYSLDGKILTARFWGGVCSKYTVEAEQSGTQVKLKVVETPIEPGRVCILIAKELTGTVTLDEPLGDRQVVDAASGERVPRR